MKTMRTKLIDEEYQAISALESAYKKGCKDTVEKLRELMIHNADQRGLDAFDESVEEL